MMLALAVLALWTPSPRIALTPCHVPGVAATLRCGSYSVPANRLTGTGPRISLGIVVIPAESPNPKPDPVLFVSPGGPGTTNTDYVGYAYSRPWRVDRDVVLIDLRGTGGADRLDCPGIPSQLGPDGTIRNLIDSTWAHACRDSLERRFDLSVYNTPFIVDDLDEVRAALGYDKVNLWGASGGTRMELVYLQRHPQSIRSVMLEGTEAPSMKNPLPHAKAAQRALDMVFADCAAEPDCASTFPHVRAELDSVLARLSRSPAAVDIPAMDGQPARTVRLTKDAFAEGIRALTYNADGSREVPLVIHRAFDGRYLPVAVITLRATNGLKNIARMGFLFSITCNEDISRIRPEEIGPATAGTYYGDTRVREQIAACAAWPHAIETPDFTRPIRSDVPVFILSGTEDPVAPPQFGAEVARGLLHVLHVVAPGGHVPSGACVARIEEAFLENPDPARIDTTCVRSMTLPSFLLR